jgi:hypothetical protein
LIATKKYYLHTQQAIWGFGLMEKLVLDWEELSNVNNGINLTPNLLPRGKDVGKLQRKLLN